MRECRVVCRIPHPASTSTLLEIQKILLLLSTTIIALTTSHCQEWSGRNSLNTFWLVKLSLVIILLSWWAHKDDDNVLFIKFEDLKQNPVTTIAQIATFMGY